MVSDSTITSADVQDGSLTGTDVQDGGIASADVQDGSLTGGDVQDASLTGTDIQDATIAQADLADGAASPRQGTSVNTTSGTSQPFNIPTWANRITINLAGVSLSGTALLRFQLGTSGGFVTSGYNGAGSVFSSGAATVNQTAGFDVYTNVPAATYTYTGTLTLNRLTGNTWVASGVFSASIGWTHTVAGSIALAAALTQVRLFTSNGTDTFDAGSMNVQFE